MKPLQKIKGRDGKVKEWRGIGTVTRVFWDDFSGSADVILIAGNRQTLYKAFVKLCGPDAIFRESTLRLVKVTKQ